MQYNLKYDIDLVLFIINLKLLAMISQSYLIIYSNKIYLFFYTDISLMLHIGHIGGEQKFKCFIIVIKYINFTRQRLIVPHNLTYICIIPESHLNSHSLVINPILSFSSKLVFHFVGSSG